MEHFSRDIDGYFGLDDMEYYKFLIEQLPDNSHFVEVGSFKGRSASYAAVEIINSGKNIKFDCVDTWKGSEEHKELEVVKNDTLFDIFLENMKPVEGYYTAIRKSSLEAAELYEDESLDAVFIDAAHDYDNVVADINAWSRKVKVGGFISGHDFVYPPIQDALRDTINPVVQFNGTACWYKIK